MSVHEADKRRARDLLASRVTWYRGEECEEAVAQAFAIARADFAADVFVTIRHGDEAHQEWLAKTIKGLL